MLKTIFVIFVQGDLLFFNFKPFDGEYSTKEARGYLNAVIKTKHPILPNYRDPTLAFNLAEKANIAANRVEQISRKVENVVNYFQEMFTFNEFYKKKETLSDMYEGISQYEASCKTAWEEFESVQDDNVHLVSWWPKVTTSCDSIGICFCKYKHFESEEFFYRKK